MNNDAWVDWPTHAGWWWVYEHGVDGSVVDRIALAQAGGEVWDGQDWWDRNTMKGLLFLDAHLTPPLPPKGGG